MAKTEKKGFLRKLLIILIPIGIVVLFAVATSVIIALNKKPEEKKRPFNTLAVMADYAKSDNVQLLVSAQGEARPRTEINLVPQVGGKITYVSPNFVESGVFRKGETLIRIDDSDYKVAVIRAEANVAQAEQVLVREKAEGEIARRDYEELGRGKPSPLALREPQKQQAEAALQAAKADLENAKLQLTRTYVKAPFSGRIRSKSSDIGQFVSPGFTLGRIFSNDILEVRLPLTNEDLSKMDLSIAYMAESREDAPEVQLSAEIAGQMQNWTGYIMRTDATYDTQTRALFAIAEVFDPYGKGASDNGVPLVPGLFVNAKIEGKTYDDVIVIPRDGLRPDNEVYVVDDKGKSEIRKVTVLDAAPERAVLTAGVEAGELIVLSPMERSRTQMTLKVLDINDPKNVLVDPPKPQWLVEKEKAEAEGSDKKKKRKKRGKKGGEEQPEKPLKKTDEPAADNSSGKSSNKSGEETVNGEGEEGSE